MGETVPNFFIVGAAKSGTTSLHRYLLQHPQICMPSWKEPHFFGEHRPPGPVLPCIEAYLDLFSPCAGHQAVGEASTQYLYSPSAAREIKDNFPDARILIVLRNPVDRAYSLFWNHVRDGAETTCFEAAMEAERSRMSLGWHSGFHYVRSGMYSEQVTRYCEIFGQDAVKVLLLDDLKETPAQVLAQTCSFLGVDYTFPFRFSTIHNKSGPPRVPLFSRFLRSSSVIKRWVLSPLPREWKNNWKSRLRDLNIGKTPPMCTDTRRYLIETFREDVVRLEAIIGRDLSHWRESP